MPHTPTLALTSDDEAGICDFYATPDYQTGCAQPPDPPPETAEPVADLISPDVDTDLVAEQVEAPAPPPDCNCRLGANARTSPESLVTLLLLFGGWAALRSRKPRSSRPTHG